MTIDNLKSLFELKGNKYQLGSLNGDEFSLIANLAQRDYFNFLIGHIEQFQPGRPVPRIGVGMGSGVMDRLSPFRKTKTYDPTSGSSILTKPPKFCRVLRMWYDTAKEIRKAELNEVSALFSSSIIPLADNPVYLDMGTAWNIYPSGINNVFSVGVEYLEEPTDMVWNYAAANKREAYTVNGSVHPQWKDTDINHILPRMLKHLALTYKDGELLNVANAEIQQGE